MLRASVSSGEKKKKQTAELAVVCHKNVFLARTGRGTPPVLTFTGEAAAALSITAIDALLLRPGGQT